MGHWVRHLWRAGRAAVGNYGKHALSQFAAAIAYRVLFSIVPLATLLVVVLNLVLPEDSRNDAVNWLLGSLPGDELEDSVERSLRNNSASASVLGLIALGTLLWSASGMMGSLRTALRVIWEEDRNRPFVGGKLLDLALVLGSSLLLISAFGVSVVLQVVVEAGHDLADALGVGGRADILGSAAQIVLSLGITFVALLVLYRLLPPVDVRLADIWPAALLAAVAIQAAFAGFSIYLARFADFSAVYGPLGAVLAFLLLVYVLAIIVLLAAEVAAAWPRTRPSAR